MLLTIIPFILAAQFAFDENYEERYRWRYGSESIYDVSVNLSRTNLGEDFCSTVSGELECRPKHSESLACRFRSGTLTSWKAEDSQGCHRQTNVTTRDHFFDEEPFEIRFHSRGVENLVVRRTIPRWRLDAIKTIVAQLDIGSELDKGQSGFVRIENSTVGSCALESKILISGDYSTENKNEFNIVSVNSNGSRTADVLSRDGNIIIEKIRRPEKCPGWAIYFFGYISSDIRTERGIFLDMVSSITRTTISKRRLSSRTISEGTVIASDGSKIGYSRQTVTLTLKSVHPAAAADSRTIRNPASTGLYSPSTSVNYFDLIRRVVLLKKPTTIDQPSPLYRPTPNSRSSRIIQL